MDSKRLAEIADVMEDRGLTRVRVEEPDGTAARERHAAGCHAHAYAGCRDCSGGGSCRHACRRAGARRAGACRRTGA